MGVSASEKGGCNFESLLLSRGGFRSSFSLSSLSSFKHEPRFLFLAVGKKKGKKDMLGFPRNKKGGENVSFANFKSRLFLSSWIIGRFLGGDFFGEFGTCCPKKRLGKNWNKRRRTQLFEL